MKQSKAIREKPKERKRNAADPFALLTVIEALEVGPVRIEKRKAIAPYTVFQNGKTEIFELEYAFEEDVFEPADPVSHNLASMIVVQVALNYGLFCKEMIFHGSFDSHDRKFIQEALENTAREILVMKFLQRNPFLVGEAADLSAVKSSNYSRAKISFAADFSKMTSDGALKTGWGTERSRHAVLSSGGKDSLLSFTLLQEIGVEVHPIFVNESGRHWFTALNAYRHFKASHSETARVWTNSDRLFNWMLRHLPFVRSDFARIRSDEYPIRLWTVAVFLFGVLPLMRKRGIGRLVIGDEYDTTVRFSYKGISHYNGLYDQSRYFDNAVTRYFMRKGWRISQFSLLRQLSELLIEKILVERYPEYQKQQLSCHAAHSDGERVYPCGKCEKCRRIVGMLRVLGADPRRCGYSAKQIDECLQALAEKGVHQESAGAEHLAHLLKEHGLVDEGAKTTHLSKAHPEIMKLRFDSERSPVNAIPGDLRKPLFTIFLKHAEGSVRKQGRVWVSHDALADNMLAQPYPFESRGKLAMTTPTGRKRADEKRVFILGELTWPEAKKRLKEVDLALLPVGAIEQHGPHLPLDTDAYDADYLAQQVAAACSDPKPIVLPLIPYGVSYHHEDFSGTISVTNETLSQLVYEIGMSAASNGITKLVIVNGHGGNASTLQFAAQMINRDAHIFTCVDTGETSDTDVETIAETPSDVHAGEIETSTSMALRPQLVDLKKAKKFIPHFSSRYLNFSSKRSVDWNARTAKISASGVLGDPTKASYEKGERIWEVMIRNLTEFVEELKSMSLNEIYERRY